LFSGYLFRAVLQLSGSDVGRSERYQAAGEFDGEGEAGYEDAEDEEGDYAARKFDFCEAPCSGVGPKVGRTERRAMGAMA